METSLVVCEGGGGVLERVPGVAVEDVGRYVDTSQMMRPTLEIERLMVGGNSRVHRVYFGTDSFPFCGRRRFGYFHLVPVGHFPFGFDCFVPISVMMRPAALFGRRASSVYRPICSWLGSHPQFTYLSFGALSPILALPAELGLALE